MNQPTTALLRLLCIILIAALASSCSWFGGGKKNNSNSDAQAAQPRALKAFTAEVRVQRVWSERIGKGLGKKFVQITPAIYEGKIYIADAYGKVMALDSVTGDRIWRTEVGRADRKLWFNILNRSDPSFVSGGVTAGEGVVLLGTVRGELIVLDAADGSELWRTRLTSEVLAPASVSYGVIAVQTSDGKMHLLELEDGERRWVFDTQDPIVSLRGTAQPVISENHVYAGFANGLVAAVEIESGFPTWEQKVTLPEGSSELERIIDVDGRPLVTTSVVYAASHQGKVRAMRRDTGDIVWEKDDPSFHSLSTGYGLVYVVRDDDVIVAADQNSGGEEWKQEAFFLRELTDPLTFGNYIVLADDSGYLHVLAQSDGRIIGRHKLKSPVRSPMAVMDGMVYVLGNKGHLEALRITSIE